MRTEHDFLGEMNVPDNVYYGVQTMRAMKSSTASGWTSSLLIRSRAVPVLP